MNHLIKDFEGEPLIGPNSLILRSGGSDFIRRAIFYGLWNIR